MGFLEQFATQAATSDNEDNSNNRNTNNNNNNNNSNSNNAHHKTSRKVHEMNAQIKRARQQEEQMLYEEDSSSDDNQTAVKSEKESVSKRKSVVTRACTNCKRAHAKCDENKPCARCVRLGKADTCSIPEQTKKRGRRKLSADEKLERKKMRLSQNEVATITFVDNSFDILGDTSLVQNTDSPPQLHYKQQQQQQHREQQQQQKYITSSNSEPALRAIHDHMFQQQHRQQRQIPISTVTNQQQQQQQQQQVIVHSFPKQHDFLYQQNRVVNSENFLNFGQTITHIPPSLLPPSPIVATPSTPSTVNSMHFNTTTSRTIDQDLQLSDKDLIQSLIAENNNLKQQLANLRSVSTNIQERIVAISPSVTQPERRRTLDLLVHNNLNYSNEASQRIGIILSISTGQIVSVCPNIRRLLGYDVFQHEAEGFLPMDLRQVDPADILLQSWQDVLHPTVWESSWKDFVDAVPRRTSVIKISTPLLKRRAEANKEPEYVLCKLMECHLFYYQPSLPSQDPTILYVLSRVTF